MIRRLQFVINRIPPVVSFKQVRHNSSTNQQNNEKEFKEYLEKWMKLMTFCAIFTTYNTLFLVFKPTLKEDEARRISNHSAQEIKYCIERNTKETQRQLKELEAKILVLEKK